MPLVKITLIHHDTPYSDIEHLVETEDPKTLETWLHERWPDNHFHVVEVMTEEQFKNHYSPGAKTE